MFRPRRVLWPPLELVAPSDGERARRRAAATSRARIVALIVLSAAWVVPAVFVWFVGLVGLVGWGSENGETPGLIDEPGSASAWSAIVSASVMLAVATVLLVAVSRWALPGRRRLATAVGLAGALWLPVLSTLVVALS